MALLVIAIISVIITQLFIFNATSTTAYSKYGAQQFNIHDAYTRLNKDIEGAAKVCFSDNIIGYDFKTITLTVDGIEKVWSIDGSKLCLDSNTITEGLSTESMFSKKNDCLVVVLKLEPTNEGRLPLNIDKPIVSQYSISYKK